MEYITVARSVLEEELQKRLDSMDDVSIVDLFEGYVDAVYRESNLLPKNDMRAVIFKQFKHYGDFDKTVMESAKTITGVKATTESVMTAMDKKDAVTLKHAYEELKRYQQRILELEDEMYRDELTGVLNRKYLFTNKMDERYALKSSGAMFVLAINNFQEINKQYGYKTGDAILKLFANTVSKNIHDEHVEFIRYTGNNFILMTPEVHATEIAGKVKKLQAFFAAKKFKVLNDEILTITFQFAQYNYDKSDLFDTVFNKAQKAMH